MTVLATLPGLVAVAIPDPDPIPLPGPAGLLVFLLLLTFALHVVLMNALLGGSLLLGVSRLRMRRDARAAAFHAQLVRTLTPLLPTAIAFTITLGIAPLLFVQVLYGPLYFSASVLMAWPWLALVGLILLAYYAAYWTAFAASKAEPGAGWAAATMTGLFLAVAFLFVNNASLMQQPEVWRALHGTRPAGLVVFAMSSPAVWIRFLHFVFGPLAVAGLLVAGLGMWSRRDPAFGRWATAYGARWFLAATGLQMASGVAFLLSQPPRVLTAVLTGAAGLLAAAIVLAVFAVGCLAPPRRVNAPRLRLGASAVGLALVLMLVLRHRVRGAWLAPHFTYETLGVQPQWAAIGLFTGLLLAGVALLGWMGWKFATAGGRRSDLDGGAA